MAGGELIGRRSEIASIRSAAETVTSGQRAVLVLLTGEPGIGKSTMLRTLARELGADGGFDMIRGGLSIAETQLTWAGLNTMCTALTDEELEGLPRVQREALCAAIGRSDQDVTDPAFVAYGFSEIVRRRAVAGRALLLVDDVHWLDAATAAVLSFAVRACADVPVLTVLAARAGELLPFRPTDLLEPERTIELQLDGVSVAALHHLLVERCDVSLGRSDATRLHQITGGNPLHAIEIGHLLAEGRELSEALLPPSLRATIEQRLADLPDHVRATLEAAAIAPDLRLGQLAAALPDVDVEEAVIRAERASIVEVDDGRVAFCHPLVRAAVLGGVGAVRRRRIARAVAARLDDAVQRSLLLADVADGPDPAVAAELEEVGLQAVSMGVDEIALQRFRRAAELTPASDVEALGRRLLLTAESAMDAGEVDLAIAFARQARSHLVADRRARADFVEIRAFGNSGRFDEAIELARRTAHAPAQRPADRLTALRLLANVTIFNDVAAARVVAEEALIIARDLGDPTVERWNDLMSTQIRMLCGEPVDLSRFVALETSDGSSHTTDGLMIYASMLVWADDNRHAAQFLRRLLRRFEAAGEAYATNDARDQLADALWRLGEWEEAEVLLQRWIEENRLLGGTAGAPRRADLAAIQAASGRSDDAERSLAQIPADDRSSPIEQLHLHAKSTFVANAAGRWDRAAEHGRRALALADATGYRDLGGAPFRAELVEALLQIGAVDEADTVAGELTIIADRAGRARGIGDAHRSQGLVRSAQGRAAEACELLDEACRVHAGLEVPLERARTLLAAGHVLRRAGRRRRAIDHLVESLATLEGLGARPWIDRARSELERAGAKAGSRADELTTTERRIAELVAAGRSNGDVANEMHVSVRTVESNLTRVYRKLGVRSRTELTARMITSSGDDATAAPTP